MKIVILLSTYNGEQYLEEQLDSLLSQTIKADLLIRDDGSEDNTINILEKYVSKYSNISVIKGKNIGYNKSFLYLLSLVKNKYDFISFADQDDIWMSNKLEFSIKNIINKNSPTLVCSDVMVVDENLEIISHSYFDYMNLSSKFNELGEFFFENKCIGNTIVINKKLASNLYFPSNILSFDWWLALSALSIGKIVFINEPLVYYRQHNNNVYGIRKINFNRKIDDYFLQVQNLLNYYLEDDIRKKIYLFLSLRKGNFFDRKIKFLMFPFKKRSFIKNLGILLLI